MNDERKDISQIVGDYKYGFKTEVENVYDTGHGINEDVVRFIQSESSNLKFVRECFDFAYSGIRVNESGSKVVLTTNEGETIVVNLEAYIHNSLMNYAAQYKPMREKY